MPQPRREQEGTCRRALHALRRRHARPALKCRRPRSVEGRTEQYSAVGREAVACHARPAAVAKRTEREKGATPQRATFRLRAILKILCRRRTVQQFIAYHRRGQQQIRRLVRDGTMSPSEETVKGRAVYNVAGRVREVANRWESAKNGHQRIQRTQQVCCRAKLFGAGKPRAPR